MSDLRDLVAGAERFMLEHGYSKESMRQYRRSWDRLEAWSEERGDGEFDEGSESSAIQALGLDRDGLTTRQRTALRAVRCLLSIERDGRMPARSGGREATVPNEGLRALVSQYIGRKLESGLSRRTTRTVESVLNRFLASLGDREIGTLSPGDVESFMEAGASMGAQTKSTMLFAIRSFARWAAKEGLCSPSVAASMPTIPAHKGSGLPSAYGPEEVAACVRVVGESGLCPKRNRAIALLGSVLAMRAGDIRNLLLSDIDWRRRRLRFTQSKTGAEVTLPLPEEVTLALADYVRNERPGSDDGHVFLHAQAPYLAFDETDDSFWRITSKGFAAAGVDTEGRHRGMHSLRHSAATGMLAAETPYPTISAVLGHASSNTTMRYMAVDVESLRRLSLEVPHA